VPSRNDFQRLVEWCDRESPFQWTKGVAGAALAVHSIVPIGTDSPRATALMTGDTALRAVSGISEFPDEPVQFVGNLVGVRNPDRRWELRIDADADRAVARFKFPTMPSEWAEGFEIQHVRDESGLIQVDWTLGEGSLPGGPPGGFGFPLLFEVLLWPALRKAVDLGPP
jgi:hypothetical protein